MDSLALLCFALGKRFGRARQERWRRATARSAPMHCDFPHGLGMVFCQCEWGSGSVAGPVDPRVERPGTGRAWMDSEK